MTTIDALTAELARARSKFPGNRFLLAALCEELGELAEAIAYGSKEAVRAEAVQVACVAIRIAEEGDAAIYPRGAVTILDLALTLGDVARNLLQRRSPAAPLEMLKDQAGYVRRMGDPTFHDITEAESLP